MAKIKWEEKAREVQRSDQYELKSLEGGVITRRKFTVEAQEQLAQIRKSMEFDADGNPINVKPGTIKKFHTMVLEAGLLDTNFVDTSDKDVVIDSVFIEKLFELPDVEQEIFDAILDLNRPLAKGSSSNSETALNGSSEDKLGTSKQEPNSPTDASRTEK